MWFDSWSALLRIVLVGAATYASLVVLLRVTGKRTLSQLNAFDFIVTVSMGSVVATIFTNPDLSWSEGFTALAMLTLLQYVVAFAAARWSPVRRMVTTQPSVLLLDGELQHDTLRKNRLEKSEVLQALRSQGIGDTAMVKVVVLETNGKLSVITHEQYGDGSALQDRFLNSGGDSSEG